MSQEPPLSVTELFYNVRRTANAESVEDTESDALSFEKDEVSTTVYYREATKVNCVVFTSEPCHANNGTPLNLEYVNEGGANIIFRFLPQGAEAKLPRRLQGKLLRLPKIPLEPPDMHWNPEAYFQIPAMEQHEYWTEILSREAVLDLESVTLWPTLDKLINFHLGNAARTENRRSTEWEGGAVGFLTTDMTAGEGEELHEFKPKWLAQSPNAPRHARRCRTCALRAKRATESVVTRTDRQSLCPLYLLTVLGQRHAERFTDNPHQLNFITKEALPVLRKLREHQLDNDTVGILDVWQKSMSDATPVRKLARAMTSRDCTIYGRCKQDGTIEVRVGDLDMKPPAVGWPKWAAIEKGLRDGGWYDGLDDVCLLSNEEDMAVVKSCYEPDLRRAVFRWTE
ncbi:Inositol-pentakisphosphate 2-kinase [Recurvomyces mirabilis]|uniref:Inositol-pentakisphosphate 2-kinase n=1 Tax=Recurvomyces mirabilis TaxID=574656 RepID=A0AAE1C3V4_9PEZI|nr:Inositol-pentakisphosphate 2-kinase [Recurvomyces mirabilis]KAK5156989.1 Inositol-pentakisphosphate 2-kinase [Recurvomyces mirabilis]